MGSEGCGTVDRQNRDPWVNALEILVLLLSRMKTTEVTQTGSTTNCSKLEACKEIQSIRSRLTNVNLASYCTQVHKCSHSLGTGKKGEKKILANAKLSLQISTRC